MRARPHIHLLRCRSGTRPLSTVTGDSGRVYTNGTLLRRHPQNRELSIYKAESAGQSFILKHASKHLLQISQQIADDFESTNGYAHQQKGLDPSVSICSRHPSGPRIHADVKPDNVLVDWTEDSGKKAVTRVVLGDFDVACKPNEGESRLTRHAIGNAMWRSPEAQTGVTGRASDVYSLGLVFCYILGAGELFLLDNYQDLLKAGITAEQEVLTRHFAYFGPVPESLYTRIPDEGLEDCLAQCSSGG
ncbi:kinase-like protein [Teratosphaeria destructans]|uniref:Kinase-like protein n=1 Tax=Teratosphaeria destructans TaxID=418781 RepID=A0A9W7W596_9PEZI|nr:kinase-like protein [Teratosphaeria destructans]